MDETGSHHSWQTNTETENQTPLVLTHKWELNSENGTSHTRACWRVRGWVGIALGEIPNGDDGGMDAANHHGPHVYLCNKPAHSAHVHQNLKYNENKNNYKKTST